MDSAYFSKKGLNLYAIFNIEDLPQDFLPDDSSPFTQLFLFAHAGRQMWRELKKAGIQSEDPVDDFSRHTVIDYFERVLPDHRYKIIYPGEAAIGLIRLGELAGWHHDSPFRIGINRDWGSWFAYRAVVLADTHFKPTKKTLNDSPCTDCRGKACIKACPGDALIEGSLALEKCIQYRKEPDSLCEQTCLARWSCPIGREHRYTEEQMRYHYSVSMKTIRKYY